MSEPTQNPIDALVGLIQSQLLDVNTSIPATVVSYANGRASVKPQPKKRFSDGDVLDYPVIPDVRVCWPSFSGGQAGIKGPVKAGDNCLLVFSQCAVDGTDDRRRFDLTDAYAVMVDNGRAGPGDSANNDDMTMFFGSAYIRLTEAGRLEIYAPAGSRINTPDFENTGNYLNRGYVTGQNGLAISGVHPTTGVGGEIDGTTRVKNGDIINLTGDIKTTVGDVKAVTVSLKTHVHSGIQPGPSNTGVPVA